MTLHQDDIGDRYEEIRDELVEIVADGIVTDLTGPFTRRVSHHITVRS